MSVMQRRTFLGGLAAGDAGRGAEKFGLREIGRPRGLEVQGRFTGRGTGIIDTLHFVEVARAAWQLDLPQSDLDGVKRWFAAYTEWLTTHPYGIAERDAKNNHGTCWCTQVAAFAQLTGNRG